MSDEAQRSDTYYEVQVDRETLVLFALGLVTLVVAAFLVGRWTAPAAPAQPPGGPAALAEEASQTEPAPFEQEDVDGEPMFGGSPVSVEGAPPIAPVPAEPVAEVAAAPAPPRASPAAADEEATPPPPRGAEAGEWVVQVGAVKSSRDAEALRARLAGKGWPVRVLREGGLSKVQVGPFATKQEADNAERRLKREERLGTWVKRS